MTDVTEVSDATPRDRATPAAQVEERLQATSPRMWLALAGFVVLIAAGLVWGFLGKAADQVEGVGVMLPSDGLYDLSSPSPGTVRAISARNGDGVKAGGTVLTITHADGGVEQVTTAIDGTVLALLVKLGSYVDAGTPVATIEPAGSDLQVVMFVGASDGKQVRPGMTVFVAPSTTPSSQFGTMTGTVVEVSRLTVSAEQLGVTLGTNSPLIKALLDRGPALEVVVQLERANTPSGFRWTASSGPAFPITSGTLADASVVIDASSPVEQILGRE
jgi:biotin carboxyl carrier protein